MSIDALTIQCHQLTTMRVFVPKHRKPVLIKDVAHRLQEIIFELVTEHGWKLIA